MNNTRMPRRPQRGFSMMEILVTIVVLSIGLLGLSGLQLSALRSNQTAYLRSVATTLSYDISDRMRANMAAVATGDYNSPTASQTAACLTNAGCTPAQMAQNDAFEWQAAIQNALPNSAGVVCLDGTPDDGTPTATACDGSGQSYAIKIWWDDDRDDNFSLFATSFQP